MIIPRATLRGLLPDRDEPVGSAALTVTATVEEAIIATETETLRRARLVAEHDAEDYDDIRDVEGLLRTVLVTHADRAQRARISAAAEHGRSYDIDAVILGDPARSTSRPVADHPPTMTAATTAEDPVHEPAPDKVQVRVIGGVSVLDRRGRPVPGLRGRAKEMLAERYGESWQVVYLLPISVDGLVAVLTLSLLDIASQVRTISTEPATAAHLHPLATAEIAAPRAFDGHAPLQALEDSDAPALSRGGVEPDRAVRGQRPAARRSTDRPAAVHPSPAPTSASRGRPEPLPAELQPLLVPARHVTRSGGGWRANTMDSCDTSKRRPDDAADTRAGVTSCQRIDTHEIYTVIVSRELAVEFSS